MHANHQKIYKKFLNKYHIFGIEADYHNLGDWTGPDPPAWLQGKVIYEIYIRAFSSEGTFNGVKKHLDEIKSLGIDVIWFMPVFPIGKIKRKGSLGCPYSIKDYFNVNPEYGTNADFMDLVEAIHDLGMRVIIDLVVNHVAHDYAGFEDHPEIVLRDAQGTPTRKVTEWSDVIDLDYNKTETWNHVLEIMRFWVEEYSIDGFRCDVAGLIPTEFWEWAVSNIRSIKKDIFMLAEWESPILHKEAFHSTYDWVLYSTLMDVVRDKASAKELADWIELKNMIYPRNGQFLRFIENHDKERAAKMFKPEQLAALLVLIFSIDGLPLIYNGQEFGESHYSSLFEKETIKRGSKHLPVYKWISELIFLRKNYLTLASKNYEFIKHDYPSKLLMYKKFENNTFIIAINFSNFILDISKINAIHILDKDAILFNTHPQFNPTQFEPYQAVIILEK